MSNCHVDSRLFPFKDAYERLFVLVSFVVIAAITLVVVVRYVTLNRTSVIRRQWKYLYEFGHNNAFASNAPMYRDASYVFDVANNAT